MEIVDEGACPRWILGENGIEGIRQGDLLSGFLFTLVVDRISSRS